MRLNPIQRDLVIKYKWIADNLAYKYYELNKCSHIDMEDLKGVAIEALCKAAYNYKEDRKASFKTYAKRAVINNILSAIPKLAYNLCYPVNILVSKKARVHKGAFDKLRAGFGSKVSIEFANNISDKKAEDIDEKADYYNLSKFVHKVLRRMPLNMSEVLKKAYGIEYPEPESVKDLAKEYGINLFNAYQRIYRAQKKFRQICGEQIDFYI